MEDPSGLSSHHQQDICRVCRSEGSPDRPLFHPCICTGSIKFIHQDCLLQWLKYSKKEYCELCSHRFLFTPIYSPDMPKRLPVRDIFSGLLTSVGTAIRYWFHYTLVAFAWLGIVPLTACRIYRCLFTGSVSSVLTLPLDMLSTENLVSDCFHGCFVVTCTLCAFISLVWLREQILHGGGPDWLENENEVNPPVVAAAPVVEPVEQQPQGGGAVQPENDRAQGPEPEAAVAPDVVAPEVVNNPPAEEVNEGNNGAQDDNWNPIEWDRAAEELTWERLLGLDGSLVFLEHVLWVVSLNTLFILVFAFCPYHIGNFVVNVLKAKDYITSSHFEGLLTTLCGYVVIGVSLVLLHALASMTRLRRSKRILGFCYVVVKVSLLTVVEIGVFPLVCGWWLDICSLMLFDATLKDRQESFRTAPGTSMFVHWLVGMVCVFYFASFVLLLREVLRPGVLWFLRNLNDPDFNPIQEMIHLPVVRHTRRFLASMVIIGTIVLVVMWLPVRTVKHLFATFLPYNVTLSSETPVSELSLELLLLQVILPALLEQGHTRHWLKTTLRWWCVAVAWILDLRSYLLGDILLPNGDGDTTGDDDTMTEYELDDDEDNDDIDDIDDPTEQSNTVSGVIPADSVRRRLFDTPEPRAAPPPHPPPPPPPPPPVNNGGAGFQPRLALGAEHQALLQGGGGPSGFQPYIKPKMFGLRIMCLVVLMCASLTVASILSLTVPVSVGRRLMYLWMGETKVHELYTAAWGLYACWIAIRCITVVHSWIPQGWHTVITRLQVWLMVTIKMLIATAAVMGVIPLLLGILFEQIVVIPLRASLHQSPVVFLWQDWALGILHMKIICAITMMGPNWWLKQAIERIYQDGVRNLDLSFILRNITLRVVAVLGLALSVPYVISQSIVPLFVVNSTLRNIIQRRIYPAFLALFVLAAIGILQIRQFKRLYEHIKNDKYLVGRRLVNYDHRPRHLAAPTTTQQQSTNG